MRRKRFRLGVWVGLGLSIVGVAALFLLNGPLYRWNVAGNVAGWTVALGVVMLAGSLIGLMLADESNRQRRLFLRFFAGIVMLAVVIATPLLGYFMSMACGMSSELHNDWACRGSSVNWPGILVAVAFMWTVAGGLVWLVLRRASADSA